MEHIQLTSYKYFDNGARGCNAGTGSIRSLDPCSETTSTVHCGNLGGHFHKSTLLKSPMTSSWQNLTLYVPHYLNTRHGNIPSIFLSNCDTISQFWLNQLQKELEIHYRQKVRIHLTSSSKVAGEECLRGSIHSIIHDPSSSVWDVINPYNDTHSTIIVRAKQQY